VTDPSLSFGAAADLYDRIRPSYPVEAVTWALTGAAGPAASSGGSGVGPAVPVDPSVRVVDLGAGTGILTRVLRDLGLAPVPVEPDAAMREKLERATPGVTALAGSAEAIPLPDASVDAVLAAQAYHWFDPETAHAEIARVLRPGGVFAPLWNIRDPDVPWLAALSQVLAEAGRAHAGLLERPDFGPRFGPVRQASLRHAVDCTPDGLLELVHSRSYYLAADAGGRGRVDAAVRALTREHPDLAGRDSFPLPYRTEVYRAVRR
jgi:SAM-dependent methyltransferase